MALHVESFAVAPLGCNCSIVADLVSKKAIVVDPGGELSKIRARLDADAASITLLESAVI